MTAELEKHVFGNGGPSVAVTAGLHGDEQTASYTAGLLCAALEKEDLEGTVTVFPFCNPTAERARQRKAPEDGKDLNRIFPGAADGTYSDKLAAEIWAETAGADYVLDLHCCGIYGSAYTMCWYTRHPFARELAKALGVPTVVHTHGTRGQFYIECCERRGQKGMLIELPGGQPGGMIDRAAAEAVVPGILNYLRRIGAVKGASRLFPVAFCGMFGDSCLAPRDGLCRPAVRPGDMVRKGDVVAWLGDEAVTAPFDAAAAVVPPERYAFAGEKLVRLAEAKELPEGSVPCKEV